MVSSLLVAVAEPLLCFLAGLVSPPFLHFLLLCSSHSRFVQPADLRSSWPMDTEFICFRPCLAPHDQTRIFNLGTLPVIHWKDNEQRLHNRTCYQMVTRALSHRVMGRKSTNFQQRSLKDIWNQPESLCLPITRLWVTTIGLRK